MLLFYTIKCPLENVQHDANMEVTANHAVKVKNVTNVVEPDVINPAKDIVTLRYITSMDL